MLRGLHYQPPPQPRASWCAWCAARVWDVAVDIRQARPRSANGWAPNFQDNQHQLRVPPGFAHGFVVLSDSADFLGQSPEAELCM